MRRWVAVGTASVVAVAATAFVADVGYSSSVESNLVHRLADDPPAGAPGAYFADANVTGFASSLGLLAGRMKSLKIVYPEVPGYLFRYSSISLQYNHVRFDPDAADRGDWSSLSFEQGIGSVIISAAELGLHMEIPDLQLRSLRDTSPVADGENEAVLTGTVPLVGLYRDDDATPRSDAGVRDRDQDGTEDSDQTASVSVSVLVHVRLSDDKRHLLVEPQDFSHTTADTNDDVPEEHRDDVLSSFRMRLPLGDPTFGIDLRRVFVLGGQITVVGPTDRNPFTDDIVSAVPIDEQYDWLDLL